MISWLQEWMNWWQNEYHSRRLITEWTTELPVLWVPRLLSATYFSELRLERPLHWATSLIQLWSDGLLLSATSSLSCLFWTHHTLEWMKSGEVKWMNEMFVLRTTSSLCSELHTSSLHQVFCQLHVLWSISSLSDLFSATSSLNYFFWATSSLSQALSEPYLFSEPKSSLSCFFR